MSNKVEKDANGRFPAEAYTPECIGNSICDIFSEQNAPKSVGKCILGTILGEDISEYIKGNEELLPDVIAATDEIVARFTDEGATLDEVRAGAQDVFAKMAMFDSEGGLEEMLKALMGGGSDGETLH